MKEAVKILVIDFYTTDLGLAVDLAIGGVTAGRVRSMVAFLMGLISLIVGGIAFARSSHPATGKVRTAAMIALVLGLIGLVLSVVHLAGSTGFGTGGGRAGAIVALVLSLLGTVCGWLARSRSR